MALFTEVKPQYAAKATAADLRSSAVSPTDSPPHWQGGFSWRTELCPAYQLVNPCTDPTTEVEDSADDVVFYQPQGFRVTDVCATRNVGFDIERVSRMTDAATSYAAARELWTGEATKAEPFTDGYGNTNQTNVYLAGPTATTITDTVADAMEALGLLEEKARQAARGQQVFLHVPTRITTQLGAQLRRVGNMIYTQTDAIVVGDPGYPGTGPDGTAGTAPGVWCYATGPVVLRLDDIQPITEAQVTVDRRSNLRQVWAERMFAATFDPCCHFALQIS